MSLPRYRIVGKNIFKATEDKTSALNLESMFKQLGESPRVFALVQKDDSLGPVFGQYIEV